MINWKKYFDKIWCINYMPYFTRHAHIEYEFKRVGILDSGIFEWQYTFDSPWYNCFFEKTKTDNNVKLSKVSELKITIGHYNCIKKSNIMKHNKILILEDDERFLKDLNMIEKILDNTPENADVVLYDYFNIHKKILDEYKARKINDYFSNFDYLNNAGCYSLSRKAIQIFSLLYDKFLLPADSYMHDFDYSKLNLVKCFSVKNMSCQATYRKSQNFDALGIMTVHNPYKAAGLNYDDYMMRSDGKPYIYGDCIYENE